MAATTSRQQQPDFSLLLDQGFPKPTAFAVSELDRTVRVEHLSDFAPHLAEQSTPDWYVYCAAAEAGFNALVVRDRSQLDQLAEMYVLSRLDMLTVVTWRKGIEDPVREWGQLLAYLPQVRQRCLEAGGRAIQLPAPTLANDSFYDPKKNNQQGSVTARRFRWAGANGSAGRTRRLARTLRRGYRSVRHTPAPMTRRRP